MGSWLRSLSFIFLALLGVVQILPAQAQEETERARLLRLINEAVRDDARHQAAVEAGQERTAICAQCHGSDGNSRWPDVPNLAGQNPAYLLEQIEKFIDGRRKNFVMQNLARSFTMEDKINIAVYFSTMEVQPAATDPALAHDGERIFKKVCYRCHGTDGKGGKNYARIAGQRPEYVITTLKRFRENAKQGLEGRDVQRHDARMEQMTQNLSDQEIVALANYVASLN